MAAGERIAAGKILVVSIKARRWDRHLERYSMGNGERDSIELCGQTPDVEALIADDHLAFVVATRVGLQVWMLPDLVVELVSRGRLTDKLARDVLEVIRPRYRAGVIEHTFEKL
ncbi:MAG: hypothetical protein ACE5HA_05450 [Anaerolineae bacterium]